MTTYHTRDDPPAPSDAELGAMDVINGWRIRVAALERENRDLRRDYARAAENFDAERKINIGLREQLNALGDERDALRADLEQVRAKREQVQSALEHALDAHMSVALDLQLEQAERNTLLAALKGLYGIVACRPSLFKRWGKCIEAARIAITQAEAEQ